MSAPGLQADSVPDRNYATAVRRYFSSSIDVLLAFVVVGILSACGFREGRLALVPLGFVALYALVYEPVLTSKLCTLGQLITGIRIRYDELELDRIGIVDAYVRYAAKYFLGVLSILIIAFNPKGKAIHDLFVGSVVLRRRGAWRWLPTRAPDGERSARDSSS